MARAIEARLRLEGARPAGLGPTDRERVEYEEYHPYGTTSWQAPELTTVSAKRYRYTGKEKDEETGMCYHGARYYLPWLGRWGSADPIGLGDGLNRYAYALGNPVGQRDTTGLTSVGTDEHLEFRRSAPLPPSRLAPSDGGEITLGQQALAGTLAEPISRKLTLGYSYRHGLPYKLTDDETRDLNLSLNAPAIGKAGGDLGGILSQRAGTGGGGVFDMRRGPGNPLTVGGVLYANTSGTTGETGIDILGDLSGESASWSFSGWARVNDTIDWNLTLDPVRAVLVTAGAVALRGGTPYNVYSDWYKVEITGQGDAITSFSFGAPGFGSPEYPQADTYAEYASNPDYSYQKAKEQRDFHFTDAATRRSESEGIPFERPEP